MTQDLSSTCILASEQNELITMNMKLKNINYKRDDKFLLWKMCEREKLDCNFLLFDNPIVDSFRDNKKGLIVVLIICSVFVLFCGIETWTCKVNFERDTQIFTWKFSRSK